MLKIAWEEGVKGDGTVSLKLAGKEFFVIMLLVSICCGHGVINGGGDANKLMECAAGGATVMVLVVAIGGQINCAVTLAYVIAGDVAWYQGIANTIALLLGSMAGAFLIVLLVPCEQDQTRNLGSNVASGAVMQSLVAEVIGTFLLCSAAFEARGWKGFSAGALFGALVFCLRVLMGPIDGCSINPSASFGPAVVSKLRGCENYKEGPLDDLWIFWVGPMIGAALSGLLYRVIKPIEEEPAKADKD